MATRTMKLPEELRSHHDTLAAALATPSLAVWEDDDAAKYKKAPQPEEIAKVLTKALHRDLRDAKIGCLFRQKIERRGQTVWAQVTKVTGKLHHYSEIDFLIEVNWRTWQPLDAGRKLALIDHELTHCGREETEAGEPRYVLLQHDIEEFDSIARRWGAWRSSLVTFANALGEGSQLGLFSHD